MTDYPPPPAGECVCGRPLPDDPVSDWACSEPCQSAWLHHRADPEYPHPRQIRDAAERELAAARARGAARRHSDQAVQGVQVDQGGTDVPTGTEINVDGRSYVRVGTHWQPAGMWMPSHDGIAQAAGYRRWCPACRTRVESLLYPANDRQECADCGHQWEGRPLLGQIEVRGAPWPGLRLRLFDGQRSVVMSFTQQVVDGAGEQMTARLLRNWLRLERQLCGGFADLDQPDEQQRRRRDRRLARDWHLCVDPT